MDFPDPNSADESGLVWVGGRLTPGALLSAYRQGIFPWPQAMLPLLWFSPPERGVLDFAELHLSRSLAKAQRQRLFVYSRNQAFTSVIRGCQQAVRPHQQGTWLTPEMVSAYTELHRLGIAHSFEAWLEGVLVGGMYGVLVDGVFSGESMFCTESDASKLCLLNAVAWLKAQGHQWMDIQMVTPVTQSLGGKTIARPEFLARLKLSHESGCAVVG